MNYEIKRTDRISEVFRLYPHLRQVFLEKMMRCVGCEILEFETIEESCKNHQMTEIDDFVALLNSRRQNPEE